MGRMMLGNTNMRIFKSSGSRRNDGPFRDQNDAVANEIVFAIHIFRFACRRDNDVVADVGVFVDNSSFDDASRTDSQRRPPGLRLWIFILVKIRAHQNRITDRRPGFDHAPNANRPRGRYSRG